MAIQRYVRVNQAGAILQTLESAYVGAHPDDADLLAALGADGCTALVLAEGEPLPDPVTQMWDGSAFVPIPSP